MNNASDDFFFFSAGFGLKRWTEIRKKREIKERVIEININMKKDCFKESIGVFFQGVSYMTNSRRV